MNVNGIEIEDPVFSAFAAKVKNAPYQSDVEWLRGMSKKDREQMLDVMESRGLIAPRDRGFFGEAEKGFNRAFIGGLRGIGATMNELGLGSGMQDYFDEVMRTNQQWNAPENPSTAGWIGGALGNGAGSMAVLAPALATDALTTKMPIATSAAVFGQSFGENLQRNRATYGPENEGKSVGLAAAESAVDTAIELALGTVPLVGKAMKGLGRGGKRELVKAMYREAEKDLGRSGAKRFFIEMGKNSGEEGLEEALQYTNTWMWRAIGGDKDNKFELKEVLDAAGQGAVGAIPFGAADGVQSVRQNAAERPWLARAQAMRTGKETASPRGGYYDKDGNYHGPAAAEEVEQKTPEPAAGGDTGLNVPENEAEVRFRDDGRTVAEKLFDEQGVKHRRMTDEEVKTEGIGWVYDADGARHEANGLFDHKTNMVLINPDNEGEIFTHSHELDHYMTKNHPEIAKELHAVMDSKMNEQARTAISDGQTTLDEFHADMLGEVMSDPEALRSFASDLETQRAGFGERFLRSVIEFCEKVMSFAKSNRHSPGAEAYFNDYKAVKAAAVKALQEMRRRNGTSTQEENTVGVQGGNRVERVAVSEINADPARFQFKSKANPQTGVDESNQIGGSWDPKTAGNLYVWEDRNGKKYVVNGHHRLQLAKQNGIEGVNAIVDRESEGVTAEQARRNGILINIRDEQGDVADYAEFVRREKLDEETAEKEGILARKKGRTGYQIGRYASDNLYQHFKDGTVSEGRAAVIADTARGDEAQESAGIKAAGDGMSAAQLKEFLRCLKEMPREKSEQGDLFGFDDSALKTAEKLSKLAAKHISEVKTKVNAAKNAIRNPEAARKLGVKVKKDAEKLLTDAQSEMQRWEHWYTDPELSAQLRREAGEETEASVSRIEGVDINAISGNIGKYFHDVKNAIRALYAKAFTHKGRNKSFVNFAQVNEEEQKMLSALCGEDFSGAEVHSIDEAGIRHMYNRHGKTEEKQDQSPLEESDFILIPEVVKDVVPKYLGKNRENNHVFQYHKKIGDEYFYLEEYRNGRGKLSGVSFWKKIGTPAAPTSKNVLDGKPTSETLRTRADKNTLHEETEKSSGEAKKIDKGRFNPESETPLLSSEEDANDFQLVGETAEDAKKADFAAEAEKKAKQARADAESKAATPDLIGEADTGAWGSKNKIVTTKVYEEQLAKLKKALNGRLHSGIDPEILSAGAVVAAYHIEAGARKFADFTSRMIEAAGENIRPYLKGLYESARRFPGMEKIAKEMDSTDFVDGYEFESNPAHLRSEIRDVIEADAESRVKGQRLKALAERHNLELKDVQEETEAVLVDMTREIDALGLSEDETFKRMAELYQKQPVLSNRTSTSIENQAYSTPVPLAWAQQKRIGVQNGHLIYEPTAGTGQLVSIAPRNRTIVNELDKKRLAILDKQGHAFVHNNDATKWKPTQQADRIIMNPPFGGAEAIDADGYEISKLDHQIAVKALGALSPDGKAAIIVGANTTGRGTGKAAVPDWRFRNYLYSHFHVADDFIVDGKLYSRQGASYPVRVITLNGRKLQADETESPSEVEKVDSWDRVYEKLKGELSDVDTETGRGNLLSAGSEGAETGGTGTAEGRGRGAGVQTGVLETAEGERVEERSEVGGREHSGAAERSGDTGSGELEGRQLSSAVRPDVSDLHERHDVRQLEEDRDVLRGEGTGSDRAGDGGYGGLSGEHRSGIGTVRADRGSDTVLPVKAGKRISALHSVYVPASGAPELGTVIPNYMAEPIARALTGVRERHGDIDEYVMSELGYGSKEDLYKAFGAEQVDGLALAIDSLQRGGSFIIGDQTGVGKGRQCAGLMRWAQKNGRIPVFFTAKSMLMTDMYYDGKDIGTDFQPLILGDVSEASVISRENGERIIRATEKKKIGKEGVKLLDNDGTYNALWLPYSQVNTRDNEQQLFIRDLLNRQKCLIVMDEAHSAAGADSNLGAFFRGDIEDERGKKRKKKKKGDEEGREKKPGILESAPVVYVSATFAKRADNMPLYYKTKLASAVQQVKNLPEVMKLGGEGLQQWISRALTEDGQMKRNERDFSGVEFDPVTYTPDNIEEVRGRYDEVAAVLRAMVAYSELVRDRVKKIAEYQKANTNEEGFTAAQSFSSISHNFISSMLLGLKLDATVKRVAESVKAGEKPVIALTETKGSFQDEYAQDHQLKTGDEVKAKFSDTLLNAIGRMHKATKKNQKSGKEDETIYYTPEQLGLKSEYDEQVNLVERLNVDLAVSPIDYLKNELAKLGIRAGEVTGRTATIDYTGKVPVLSRKSEAEQSKNGQVNAFNRGGLDVIILNAAGSTGISLHADRRFKDQRKRKMFMVQPSLDINQVMQMFGRILRSGQVVKPSYEILSLDLPAERRPTMVLAKKMRSLNANTSANAKGNVDLGVDFLNKYGDDVALEYLQNHSDIQQKTGIEILTNAEGEPIGETEDLMKKLLGKGALLSNAEQEDMYRELEDAYRDYTEELKARGDYDLEMEVHEDWDVKILEERQALPGNGNGGLFGQPVNLKTVDMREKVSVPSLDEYTKEIKNNGLEDRAAALKKAEDLCRPIEDAIRRIDATVWPGKESDFIRERQYANQKRLNEFREWVRQFHNQPLTITVGENTYQGALSDIRVNKPDPKNPAMGSIVLRFAIGDSIGHLRVPYRSIATGRVGVYLSSKSLDEIFTGQKQTIRVQRQVMTGNLAGAYEMMLAQQAAGQGNGTRGKVVTYRTAEGTEETGILIPKTADMTAAVDAEQNTCANWQEAFAALPEPEDYTVSNQIRSKDGHFSITRMKGRIMFRTERSKRTGGTYFLDEELIRMIGNEFRSSGAYMQAQRWDYSETEHPQLKNILKYLYEKGTVFYRVANERREYSLKTGKKKQDSDGLLNTIRNLIRGVLRQEDLGALAVRQKLADIFNISHAREEVKPYLEKIIDLIDAFLRSDYPEGSKTKLTGTSFRGVVANALGFDFSDTGSAYLTIEDKTIRIADHSGNAENFKTNDNIGIIIQKTRREMGKSLEKKYVEYIFNGWYLNKHPELIPGILFDIGMYFKTGEYHDRTGAVAHKVTGPMSFRTAEEAMIEQDRKDLERIDRQLDASESVTNAVKQKYGSGNTSLRQVAAGFKKIEFQPGTVNLDLGGGKYDEGTKYLAERGVKNLVFDPVNRDSEHNQQIFEAVKNGGVDTVTCNNVLNVIKESAARDNVILQCAKALKPGGTAYFTVYEGDGNGTGRQSQADSWQEHRKTADYMEEIKRHFKDVFLKNKVITAREPLTDGKLSAWAMDPTFENPRMYSLRRRQVNPIIEDKALQEEYAEELKKNEYTPETLKQWDEAAVKWILRHGGILGTVEAVLDGSTHKERHVSALVYRHVMNSDVFRKLPRITRVKFEIEYVFDGTAWGREGVARRIAALTLDSVEKVQALFDKLDSKLPDAERIKLWKQIKEKYGIDLTELPEHIAEDRKKLDGILRAYSAAMASTGDKIYEYWLNAILSGPQTHAANIIGNTANALYELGPKRLAEAAVNLLAKKKDAATFGEFREMWKAFDAKRAWKKALEAYDLETLNPEGKFNESANVAIDGKTGRAIRIPGRLLRAADAFSRELLIPVEAASRAYRSGKADGLNGEALARHIREELKNPASSAMRAATASATAMIFQEDPGTTVNYLIGLKNKNTILKYMLPFVRTPYNILRQGIRKSPLGALNLAKETADVLLGKRAIDSEYLGHVAEQLQAWGAFLALGGLDDDDEPWITGSSEAYGSSKEKFRRNTLPPYSIRIGDTWYSYRRIEPLSTALAMMADAKEAIRQAKNGKEISTALGHMLRNSGKMISEKSYLDSLNQLYRFMEDPEHSVTNWGMTFTASAMPNLARQTLTAFDPMVRDMKTRDGGAGEYYDIVLSKMGFARRVPRVDVFGREVGKQKAEQAADAFDGLYRLFVPIERKEVSSGHNGTDIITKWNWTHPEEEWHPSEPAWKGSIGGKKYQMDSETYHDYCVDAGKLADRQINNAVRHRLINPGKPTEAQMELMKKIFSRARKETKERYIRQRRIQLTR